jgi:uncharacterized protein
MSKWKNGVLKGDRMAETQASQKRSLLSIIFNSPSEPRLRAGWRLLIQTILLIILAIIAGRFLSWKPIADSKLRLRELAELFAFAGSIYLARRFLDKRSFASLGFKVDRFVVYDILAGFVITFVLLGLIFVVLRALNWLQLESFAWNTDSGQVILSQTVPYFMIFILVGVSEELLYRGYYLQTLTSGRDLFWGLILSSTIFGIEHLSNPNATWVGAVGDGLLGVFFAYGYIRTKQLWLPIGLHIGWNLFDSTIFGFPVSGWSIYSLIHINLSGPEVWTGGGFGTEAGVIVLPAIALGIALIYFYTRRRVNYSA